MSRTGALGPHDVGGEFCFATTTVGEKNQNSFPIDTTDQTLPYWAKSMHSLVIILSSMKPPLLTADELRRGVEALEPEVYKSWGYYEKWAAATAQILLERKAIDEATFIGEIDGDSSSPPSTTGGAFPTLYQEGDKVQVREEHHKVRWRRPHLRCPGYIFGSVGTISKVVGTFADPSLAAFRGVGPKQPLYSVVFALHQIWSHGNVNTTDAAVQASGGEDTIELEVYQDWLLPVVEKGVGYKQGQGERHTGKGSATTDTTTKKRTIDDGPLSSHQSHSHSHHAHAHAHGDGDKEPASSADPSFSSSSSSSGAAAAADAPVDEHHNNNHDHDHHHHDHVHEDRYTVEQRALEREGDQWPAGRVVVEALLRTVCGEGESSKEGEGVAPALTTRAQIARGIEKLETVSKELAGSSLVARAWKDPQFKDRLVHGNSNLACEELNINASNPNTPTVLRVMENTPEVHNIIVCTLCSCYPLSLLGYSPAWYKSATYRARTVREPRKVLAEFGTFIPENVKVMVHDSTADCRYMVLPMPPKGVDVSAHTEEELRRMVTRDSMIGVSIL